MCVLCISLCASCVFPCVHLVYLLVCVLCISLTVCYCGTFERLQQAIFHKWPKLLCKASSFWTTSSNPTLPTWLATCYSTATGRGCYIPHCLIPVSSNLQHTSMSSELTPPGYWQSHLFLLHQNISLGASMEQMLKHQWWPHGDVMCTIHYAYTSIRCRTSSWLTFSW